MRVALYARVSTADRQTCESQLMELRDYAARRWTIYKEYVDQGVSGARASRPALDAMMADARRRRFDVLCVWSLDRLGRSLRNLIDILDDVHSLQIAFVSVKEGLDLSTPSGRMQWQIIGAISEFERSMLQQRVRAGIARARAQGIQLGRPRRRIDPEQLTAVAGLPKREAARRLGIPRSTLQRALAQKPVEKGV